MARIASLHAEPLDLELNEPFGIATGAQDLAANVLLQLTTADGVVALGEAAPFPAVNGETQVQALQALREAAPALVGASVSEWRATAALARELLAASPSALCAFETALLDAYCKRTQSSLLSFFGGAERALVTDITLTTGSVEATARAAERAGAQGFDTLKVKVGGGPLELDAARLRAVAEVAPRARLLLDGNASFTAREALALLDAVSELRERVVLFEQPTAAPDHEGLADVRRHGRVRVAADESARSAGEVARLANRAAVDVVNIKITKTGIVAALDMIGCAKSHGLALMIGGMVESRLCMSTSACLAAGLGGFEFVDLDTPLFLRSEPFQGGFRQSGQRLDLEGIRSGHGVALDSSLGLLPGND